MFHPSLHLDRRTARDELLERGYLRMPAFLNDADIGELEAEVADLCSPTCRREGHFVLRDASGFVILMNGIDKASDALFDFARRDEMIGLASDLLGKCALSLHVEYFAKPPHRGSAAPPHQDHAFYHAHFPDELALSFWIAIDDVVPDSGALEYGVRSPHELLPHVASSAVDFGLELATPPALDFEVATVPRGGALVHHSYTVHRTRTNRSSRPRRVIVFNYRGSPYRESLRTEAA
jgi:hypothetical protein